MARVARLPPVPAYHPVRSQCSAFVASILGLVHPPGEQVAALCRVCRFGRSDREALVVSLPLRAEHNGLLILRGNVAIGGSGYVNSFGNSWFR